VYTVLSPTSGNSLFGSDSALANAISLAFENGASRVIAVPVGVTAEAPDSFTVTGSQTEFVLTGGLPAMPLDSVTVDSVLQTEGTDFTVDYGNATIIFATAPEAAADIDVEFSSYDATNFGLGLAALEDETVQLVCGAYLFDATILEDIKDHCIDMSTIDARQAAHNLKNGEASTTLDTTLESEYSILVAHNSELGDPASALLGLISSKKPWESVEMKPIKGLGLVNRFTPTERDTLMNQNIVILDKPRRYSGGFVVRNAKTLSSESALTKIYIVRIAIFMKNLVENGLTNPNVIGEMQMNKEGLAELDSFILSIVNPYQGLAFDEVTIDNAARTLFNVSDPTPEQELEMAALQASGELIDSYAIDMYLKIAAFIVKIEFNINLGGA
jgi:hypothetical protein